ncbi:MAG TPA: GNAT family N-acetyltransferase [Frankiaceae bacterium]|nr:GNAT family N-acetyltransferase [Frankiaceae bacterium]
MTVRVAEVELPRAAAVLGDAFHDDPLLVHTLPDAAERARLAAAHFLPIARLAFQTGEVWRSDDFGAVACWVPPGRHDATAEEWAASGMDRMPEILGDDACARIDAVFAHLTARRAALGVPGHWYLSLLGVARAAQGRGLGGAVVAPRLRACDDAGEWCFLETLGPRNVPFYERHGFAVVEADTAPGSGLPYWLFLRPPGGRQA